MCHGSRVGRYQSSAEQEYVPYIRPQDAMALSSCKLCTKRQVAENLLLSGDSRILEVARRCGYSDQSYFGYCFKKFYGVSPARMRQEGYREDTHA